MASANCDSDCADPRETEGVVNALLDELGAETYSGIGRFKLRGLRRERRGPTIVRIGRSVRYRPEDLDAYIRENRVAASDLPSIEHRVARGPAAAGARRR